VVEKSEKTAGHEPTESENRVTRGEAVSKLVVSPSHIPCWVQRNTLAKDKLLLCSCGGGWQNQGMERRSPVLPICITMLILLPMLYVLSVGPVIRLVERGRISGDEGSPADYIYSPLFRLAERSEALESLLGGYMQLWVEHSDSPAPAY